MFTKLTSKRSALWLFGIAAAFIILISIMIFLTPGESGRVGIYIQPALDTLVTLYKIACVLLVVSVIMYAVRSRYLIGTVGLILGLSVIALPYLSFEASPQVFQAHESTLVTQDHVYQLAESMFQNCPDTFDASTYTCYNRIFLYQCDASGLMCSRKSPEMSVHHENLLNLRLDGKAVEVISDENKVVYTLSQ